MTAYRKQPGVVFWATVAVVVLLVLYPLSFGPACWLSIYLQPSGDVVSIVYCPVLMLWEWGPNWLGEIIVEYGSLSGTEAGIYMRGSRVCVAFE
jgi:hypothetical protein